MVHAILPALGRAIQLHPGWAFLLGFVLPIALAYWFYALAPYRRGRFEHLLSPWHVRRPSVPGVLERSATWEWANSQLEENQRSEVETTSWE